VAADELANQPVWCDAVRSGMLKVSRAACEIPAEPTVRRMAEPNGRFYLAQPAMHKTPPLRNGDSSLMPPS